MRTVDRSWALCFALTFACTPALEDTAAPTAGAETAHDGNAPDIDEAEDDNDETGPERGPWVDLSVSEDSICALSDVGRLWCWQLDRAALAAAPNPPRRPRLFAVPPLERAHVESGSGSVITTKGEVLRWYWNRGLGPLEGMDVAVDVVEHLEGGCALSSSGEVQCWMQDEVSQTFGVDVRELTASNTSVCIVGAAGVECVQRKSGTRMGRGNVLHLQAGLAPVPELADAVQLRVADPEYDVGQRGELCGRSDAGVVTCVRPMKAVMLRAGIDQWWTTYEELWARKYRRSELEVEVEALALPEPVLDFDLDWDHGCAVGESGRVYCWGDGRIGQLGDGELHQLERGAWVEVAGLDDAVDVDVGYRLSCALREGGALSCWGDGQIIPGGGSWTPKRVFTHADALRVLPSVTCAGSNGTWRCIGVRMNGQGDPLAVLEIAKMPERGRLVGYAYLACTEPRKGRSTCGQIPLAQPKWRRDLTLRNVESLTGGYAGVTAVIDDHLVDVHALRRSDMDIERATELKHPDMVRGVISAQQVCAVLEDGSVVCRARSPSPGLRSYREGDPPKPVAGATDVVDLVLTVTAGCARHENLRVSCWGSWVELDEIGEAAPPREIRDMGLTGVVELIAGQRHFCARSEVGGVQCWGSNAHGALGVEGLRESSEPLVVPGIAGVVEFGAHQAGACVRTNDDEVWCWGSDFDFELGGLGRARALPVEMQRAPLETPADPRRDRSKN